MRPARQLALGLPLLLAASLAWGQASGQAWQANYLDRWQGTTYPAAPPAAGPPARALVLNITAEPYTWIFNVVFWDDQNGWAAGYGGVFATSDGGYTWQRRRPRGGWLGLGMTGPHEIWLLGEGKDIPRALWRSTDGGQTWAPALTNPALALQFLCCRGREIWASGQNRFFHSADGGATWEEQRFGGLLSSPFQVALPADRATPGGFVVYATGTGGQNEVRLVKSEDAGKTWAQLPLPADLSFPRSLDFVTSDSGWIGGDHGEILATADGGRTWDHRDLPTHRRVIALWFDQLGRGYAALRDDDFRRLTEPEALYQTADGGRSWTSPLHNDVNLFGFCDRGPDRVWGVGVTRDVSPEGIVVFLSR